MCIRGYHVGVTTRKEKTLPTSLITALFLTLTSFSLTVADDKPLKPVLSTDLFTSGTHGYHTFRIPAVIATKKGTLLAFCEGRKNSRSDTGDIDLVYRRSTDGGKTWSKLQVLWNEGPNTAGNPCPVVDTSNGRIWLPMTWNNGKDPQRKIQNKTSIDTRRVFITFSDDDGQTWAKPKEITKQAKRKDWTWYATGPGNGIQIQRGKHKGRLVIPCDHNVIVGGKNRRRSHCLYSDDHGKSWKISESLDDNTNECTVAELSDGRLMLNMRSYHGQNRRAVSYSKDGGHSWSKVILDKSLLEPVCQASLIRYSFPGKKAKTRLIFSNPASKRRERMTLRISRDDGKTWPHNQLVYTGSSAYSCLVALPKGKVGLLYERDGYRKITFSVFGVGDINQASIGR